MPRSSSELDAAFGALADESRREMIRLLLLKPRRAGELAESVAMSPQATSRHLRVLRKAGLVIDESLDHDARVRVYSMQPTAFRAVKGWVEHSENLWHKQLTAFKEFAEEQQKKPKIKA